MNEALASDRRRMTILVLSCLAMALPAMADDGQGRLPVMERLEQLRAMIGDKPADVEEAFNALFLKEVPPAMLQGILAKYFKDFGPVTKYRTIKASETNGQFKFITEKGFSYSVTLAVEEKPPNKITGLLFGAGAPLLKTLDEIGAAVKKLPGRSAMLVAMYNGNREQQLLAANADEALAIGSTFKLYVLAELVRAINAGERKWDNVATLDAKAISIPSGILQDWPPSSPLTLHTLAALMISKSDNTATDQLIGVLGRDKVAKVQALVGHKRPELNQPFLTTLEFFKLKFAPDENLPKRYVAADVKGRLELLNGPVAAMSRSDIKLGLYTGKPVMIDRLEWFASAADLSRAMNWLRDQTDEKSPAAGARGVIAINPGLTKDQKTWRYWGFKGGSEGGVLNLSLLLERADGRWFTVVATWNNAQRELDEQVLLGLAERAIDLIAVQDGKAGAN